jgi:hypothetical protein
LLGTEPLSDCTIPEVANEKYDENNLQQFHSTDCQDFMLQCFILNSHLISLHRNSGVNKAVTEIKRIFMTQIIEPCTIKYKKQMQAGAAPNLFLSHCSSELHNASH